MHVLHVHMPAVRLPERLLGCARVVVGHQREHAIAMQLVAPSIQRTEVRALQVFEGDLIP